MKFGRLGSRGGFGAMGRNGGSSVPSWVLPGAAVDLNFAQGLYFGGTLASLLSISRASNATDLLPTSASGYAYNTYGSNVLAVSQTFGLLIFEARTNQLLNSTAPATQTTASLGVGTYTLWVNGSGAATPSAGTATITGAASATNGSPNTFTVTVAGTVTVTVTGSLNAFQLEAGGFGTSFIVTAGATATRAQDTITTASTLLSTLQGAQGSLIAATDKVVTLFGNHPRVVGKTAPGASFSNWCDFEGAGNGAGTYNGTTLLATANAAVLTSPNKIGFSWSAGGRSLVLNNGTVATDAVVFTASSFVPQLGADASSSVLDGLITRLTVFNTKIPDATLKAFTQ